MNAPVAPVTPPPYRPYPRRPTPPPVYYPLQIGPIAGNVLMGVVIFFATLMVTPVFIFVLIAQISAAAK